MAQIEHVIQSLQMHHPESSIQMLMKAYEFALSMHEGQKRHSGEPYIVHPMSVAKITADMGLCEPSICAALLHDVIEDTDTTKEQIANIFGQDVAILVDGLTKLDNVQFVHKEQQQAESFRKMLIATVEDIRILLIKLADRLHNMSTLDALSPEKQERIAQETKDIYTPLAGRLGLAWLKAELDDLSFKHLEPETYNILHETVKKTRKSRILFINRAKRSIVNLLTEKGFKNFEVSGRLKNLYSIHLKMVNKDLDFEKIHDAIAFRVICNTVEECYAIFGYIHATWVPVPGQIKDYIAMPKPNHYKSLHTTVIGTDSERMEIQIRTYEMHKVNEYGIAAHWTYKESAGKKSDKDIYIWLREILENQKELEDSKEFFDSVKVELLHGEVYVFTPTGEVRILSNGSTPLDFAYAIHSEVGNHCQGAKVNGVMVPFDTALKNGDYVEIITQSNQRPSPDWLEIAKTSKARNRIKSYLRAEQKEQSQLLGRALLEKALRKAGLSWGKVIKSGKLDEWAQKHKCRDGNEAIAGIGQGRFDENQIVTDLTPDDQKNENSVELRETTFEKLIRSVKWQDDGIVIDGVDNLMVQFAKCCNPLPGEPVLGYISRGRGIIVHRQGCQQASLLEKDRQTRVSWSDNTVCKRPVKLKITTGDKPGVLANMTNIFLANKINLSSVFSETTTDKGAVTIFEFPVDNISKLNHLIRALRSTKDIFEITRINN